MQERKGIDVAFVCSVLGYVTLHCGHLEEKKGDLPIQRHLLYFCYYYLTRRWSGYIQYAKHIASCLWKRDHGTTGKNEYCSNCSLAIHLPPWASVGPMSLWISTLDPGLWVKFNVDALPISYTSTCSWRVLHSITRYKLRELWTITEIWPHWWNNIYVCPNPRNPEVSSWGARWVLSDAGRATSSIPPKPCHPQCVGFPLCTWHTSRGGEHGFCVWTACRMSVLQAWRKTQGREVNDYLKISIFHSQMEAFPGLFANIRYLASPGCKER
jgi:hypothetical protein